MSHDARDLSREPRDLARFGGFGEAEIWSHDSFPNLICKNLGCGQANGIYAGVLLMNILRLHMIVGRAWRSLV